MEEKLMSSSRPLGVVEQLCREENPSQVVRFERHKSYLKGSFAIICQ